MRAQATNQASTVAMIMKNRIHASERSSCTWSIAKLSVEERIWRKFLLYSSHDCSSWIRESWQKTWQLAPVVSWIEYSTRRSSNYTFTVIPRAIQVRCFESLIMWRERKLFTAVTLVVPLLRLRAATQFARVHAQSVMLSRLPKSTTAAVEACR